MTNEQKALLIADQCKPCSIDFYEGVKQGVKIALDAEEQNFQKASQWDRLAEKIGEFYEDEESEGDLGDIGEVAASAFGFL